MNKDTVYVNDEVLLHSGHVGKVETIVLDIFLVRLSTGNLVKVSGKDIDSVLDDSLINRKRFREEAEKTLTDIDRSMRLADVADVEERLELIASAFVLFEVELFNKESNEDSDNG